MGHPHRAPMGVVTPSQANRKSGRVASEKKASAKEKRTNRTPKAWHDDDLAGVQQKPSGVRSFNLDEVQAQHKKASGVPNSRIDEIKARHSGSRGGHSFSTLQLRPAPVIATTREVATAAPPQLPLAATIVVPAPAPEESTLAGQREAAAMLSCSSAGAALPSHYVVEKMSMSELCNLDRLVAKCARNVRSAKDTLGIQNAAENTDLRMAVSDLTMQLRAKEESWQFRFSALDQKRQAAEMACGVAESLRDDVACENQLLSAQVDEMRNAVAEVCDEATQIDITRNAELIMLRQEVYSSRTRIKHLESQIDTSALLSPTMHPVITPSSPIMPVSPMVESFAGIGLVDKLESFLDACAGITASQEPWTMDMGLGISS